MNPPCPRRTVLTRTALLPPGKTTTSPALTSPAKTTSSTNDDNTAGDDRLHPYRERDMDDICTVTELPPLTSGSWYAGNPGCAELEHSLVERTEDDLGPPRPELDAEPE